MTTPKTGKVRVNHRQTHEEISLKLIEREQERSKSSENARDVSCLALNFFYDYMEAHGYDRGCLQAGLPYTPDHLNNRVNWIDYRTFCTIEARLAEHFSDPDLYYKVGCSFRNTKGLGFVQVIMRSVLSPLQVYALIPRMLKRFLFPNVTAEYVRTARNELRGMYVFNPGYAPSDAWIETTRGILSSIPTMMGVPPAHVQATRLDELTIQFQVTLHRWVGPFELIRGNLKRLTSLFHLRVTNGRAAKHELENANALLHEKVEELTAAKSSLTTKVRDLSVLNRLSLQATGQLDLQRLIRSAVRVISDELGGLPNAVLLTSEDEDVQIAGSIGFDANALQSLDRTVSQISNAEIQDRATSVLQRLTDWCGFPMRVGARVVGILLTPRDDMSPVEPALFRSIANQLAVAIDNAQSYRVINDLRDNLEVRVVSRTAQLEEARVRLEDTVLKLEEADRAKHEFFTNVSHELKTPLTLIMAPLDELRQGSSHPDILDSLDRNAQSLYQLVEELLDFSKLDDGRFDIHPVSFDLAPFVQDIVATLSPLAAQRDITLTCQSSKTPYPVHAEPRMVRRILRNLITNAIKYINPGDTIDVSMSRTDDTLCVSVADTGPGISDDDKNRVFDRFYRCPNTQRKVKGSGIGLAMARDLAELLEGGLELTDTPHGGATFILQLPGAVGDITRMDAHAFDADDTISDISLELLSAPIEEPAAPLSPHGLRVLIVDDNPDIRSLMRRLLSTRYDVVEAVDGHDGLRKAAEAAPDLILSDVSMPGMDGFEFCRQVKANQSTSTIPVLLVTARHGSTAAVEGFAHGADDYITKPFSPQELIARVDAHIRIRSLTVALIRAEKQASLGAMSAGIAHQILNPVSVVLNAIGPLKRAISGLQNAENIEKHLRRSEKMLTAIETSGTRISNVVDAVLRLARQDSEGLVFRPTCIGEHLESVITMLGYRLSQGFELTTEFGYTGYVDCVPDLLDQAVLNVLNNAMDAMGTSGQLQVKTAEDDGMLLIQISDSGPGIPDEVRARIFNPFFTTKTSDGNAGLGLALVTEIMSLHGGNVRLVASNESGSTFELQLPLVRPPWSETDDKETSSSDVTERQAQQP